MRRDAALRGAFNSLFAFLCGKVRVSVRPDCHQDSHHLSSNELRVSSAGGKRPELPSSKVSGPSFLHPEHRRRPLTSSEL